MPDLFTAAVNGFFTAFLVTLLLAMGLAGWVLGMVTGGWLLPRTRRADERDDYRRWLARLSPLEEHMVEYVRAQVLDDDPVRAQQFKLACYRVILEELGEAIDQPSEDAPPARVGAQVQLKRLLMRLQLRDGML